VTNPYDLVRYPNWPVSETHPASLGTLAILFGRPAAPFSGCRVLEVGCGEAVNLMSMALGAPNSAFVGVDLAEAPIALGRDLARAAGLDNVSLFARDITGCGAGFGQFDYIIAHGLYAWVPKVVREALMRLAAECLKPDGLVFISYNVRPGCGVRQVLRDLMRDSVRGIEDTAQRVDAARETLARFIDLWSEDDSFQNALIVEARDTLKRPPTVLYHDELGAVYAPQLLSDVVAAARAEGLEYLCDAKADRSAEALFPSEKDFGQPRADWARFEQAMDFADMRRFRRSIFCRAGAIDRALRPDRLRGLWASADIKPDASDPDNKEDLAFRTNKGAEIVTADPRFAALLGRLGETFPQSIPLDEAACEPTLAEPLLRLFVAKIATLQTEPLRFATTPGERPLASPLARAQAAQGDRFLASLLHKPVQMEDADVRAFVTLMDGARTREDLAREMARQTGVAPAEALARTRAAVDHMARLGLMIG
jgi:SAM-dependent methyltransferase